MNQCRPDGEIRAYLDGEPAEADRERLSRHFAECAGCEARAREMEARAARIATALSALADDVLAARPRPAARPARLWPRWAAAGTIAAAAALLLVQPWGRTPQPQGVAVAPRGQTGAPAAFKEFVPLDNEPIDAGLVVRVSLGPDNVQADVVVSADGRARAYRLVDAASTD